MKELAYHCSLYIRTEENETEEEAAQRLESVLESENIEYQKYDTEMREI